ncbi:MAG: phosphatidate cytidylyltransferase [Clostridia bacterium]|jgi:phosphatidate cytidylyltransferase|uniref:phosphatidate cytidylyltransferase n=1 Tax=Pumilibacter muris TaxID=2941510 RepID=UPI00203D1A17|nr:phosphatidate cytidylyltransferase [Pumilibacter muris]MCI8595952.1 phosphatidate cytidylyltransferase [Clostridia bacterium]
MKTRSITAIFIAAVYVGTVLLSIYVNKIFFDIFVLMVAVGAGIELCRALDKRFSPPLDIFVFLHIFLGYLAFFFISKYLDEGLGIAGFFGVFALLTAICFICCAASKKRTKNNAISTVLAMIYPVTVLSYMLGLNYLPAVFRVDAILLVFIVSCLTDTFAYFVGSLLKGPKLCPNISPKKTISGAVGGLLGGVGGAMLVYMFARFGWLKTGLFGSGTISNVVHFIMLGLLGSVFNQIGDLVASYLKRKCGIKDYGTFMPGHGGVLDRIDGMMFNAVVIYIYLSFLII